AMLTEGRSDDFRRSFLITHFFNPPRYMRLIELVTGPVTDATITKRVEAFVDRTLGKSVVWAKDTPGFIANRIGTYWIQLGFNAAFDLGVTVEEADAIAGKPMGVPKTGIFGLVDLVGLDLMPHLQRSLLDTLPKDDAFHGIARTEPLLEKMISEGYTGRKGGFYRLEKAGDEGVKQGVDLQKGEYHAATRPAVPAGPAAKGDLEMLVEAEGKHGEYAWAVLGGTVAYAAALVPQISDTIV